FAGGALGGEAEFIRPQITLTSFRPVTRNPVKSYFGVNFEAGYIDAIGEITDDEPKIFPQQRFFLGGDDSIRGFRRRSVVVREENGDFRFDEDGFPLGGDAMLLLNLEYHIDAGGPFRVVLFGDAGGVFDTSGEFGPAQSIDPDLFRYSAGVEMRVRVPIFPAPLRFIYARNLDPLENDQFDSFDFSLSTAF
ncbi:MAG: BamA/TamA family outer membrane protein, partial [Acidobacteriota bacterium]